MIDDCILVGREWPRGNGSGREGGGGENRRREEEGKGEEGRREKGRACFKENLSLHISIAKAGLQFLKGPFYQKQFLFIQPNFTPQTAFHHCTFRFITAHFVNHCTLKQALERGASGVSVSGREMGDGRRVRGGEGKE